MFGWINDCTECLVISKFGGEDVWHKIKEKANSQIADGGFLRYKYYPDSVTVNLVVAAADVLDISVDDVLYAFGEYFVEYAHESGYSNVLKCLGGNLRDWLCNLDTLHDNLKASYPKGFVVPTFWSEDDNGTAADCPASSSSSSQNSHESIHHAILVHYYSTRGSLLSPLVVGLIKKTAREYFDLEIKMEQVELQDEDNGVPHTTWRVTTVDPKESYRLYETKKRNSINNSSINYSEIFPHYLASGNHDDDNNTVTTAATSTHHPPNDLNNNYDAQHITSPYSNIIQMNDNKLEQYFWEGSAEATNLRIEEFVMRSFCNEDCELYHALTLEQYLYLVEYWKSNRVYGKWCYEIWSIQDDDTKPWVRLSDLPVKLNPETMDLAHFGGQIPATGKYPPSEQGALQSFPPKVRVIRLNPNTTTNDDFDDEQSSSSSVSSSSSLSPSSSPPDDGMFVDLTLAQCPDSMLEDVICNAPQVLNAGIRKFDMETQLALDAKEKEIQVVVWDEITQSAYHTFSLDDLKTTSTSQLYELVPKSFDPIPIVFLCVDAIQVSDDEEDL